MNVLLVTNMYPSAARPTLGIFVRSQVESLQALGVNFEICLIDGRTSALNYLKAISEVRRKARQRGFDLVHAHYGLSGFVAIQQRSLPVLVSFCGSDLMGIPDKAGRPTLKGRIHAGLSRHAARHARRVIVKSRVLGEALRGASPFEVIPNGVDTELFRPGDQPDGGAMTGGAMIGRSKILFAGNIEAPVKRYPLAQQAVESLRATIPNAELVTMHNRSQKDVVRAMNECQCLLLTSSHEGSPNVIKEAMACNLPVVTTRVGDVEEQFGDLPGHYIADSTAVSIAGCLSEALTHGRTNGRARILERLALPAIARRVQSIYQSML